MDKELHKQHKRCKHDSNFVKKVRKDFHVLVFTLHFKQLHMPSLIYYVSNKYNFN